VSPCRSEPNRLPPVTQLRLAEKERKKEYPVWTTQDVAYKVALLARKCQASFPRSAISKTPCNFDTNSRISAQIHSSFESKSHKSPFYGNLITIISMSTGFLSWRTIKKKTINRTTKIAD